MVEKKGKMLISFDYHHVNSLLVPLYYISSSLQRLEYTFTQMIIPWQTPMTKWKLLQHLYLGITAYDIKFLI